MNTNRLQYAAVVGTAMILVAATPQDPQQDKRTSQGFVLKAGEHSLLEVIRSAAKFLGRNYLVSDADFAASPTITLDKTLNLDMFGCEEVVSQLAYTHNFAMTAVDVKRGIYEFIFTRGPRRPEINARAVFMKPEEILRRPKLKMMVSTAVQLEHAHASKVAATLRPFFAMGGGASGVQVATSGNDKTLLLAGFVDQLAAALEMLGEVDKGSEASPDVLDRLNKIEMRLTTLERRLSPAKK